MPFKELAKTADIMLLIVQHMDPRHLGNLCMACSLFNRSITTDMREKSVQDASKRYTQVVLLPNGGFRFHSMYGAHSLELALVPGMRDLFPQLPLVNTRDEPLMSMRYNGQFFVGRAWDWGLFVEGGQIDRDFEGFDNTALLFERGSSAMMDTFPGGVCISSVEHNNVDRWSYGGSFTSVRLACNRGLVVSISPGTYFLHLEFSASGF
jgi:hypothetical protein